MLSSVMCVATNSAMLMLAPLTPSCETIETELPTPTIASAWLVASAAWKSVVYYHEDRDPALLRYAVLALLNQFTIHSLIPESMLVSS